MPNHDAATVRRLVDFLSRQSYVGGIFVDDTFSSDIPGALPLSSIGLMGNSSTPRPAISVNFKTFLQDPATLQSGVEIADSALQEGQGMHGSLSRSDTFNNLAAIGPDFKAGYVDASPMSNADIVPTLAKLMNIDLPFSGTMQGRVLWETFKGYSDVPPSTRGVAVSGTTANGLATALEYQTINSERYYDRACLISASAAAGNSNPCVATAPAALVTGTK